MRFSPGPVLTGTGPWSQDVAQAEAATIFGHLDLSGLGREAQESAMEDAANAAHASLDITAGPLIRAVLFTLGTGRPPRLFLTVHHLVTDGVSWRVLLGDLDTAYRQARSGQPVDLGARTTGYPHWARTLAEHVRTGAFSQALDYWAHERARIPAPLPGGRQDGGNSARSARTVTVRLGPAETEALLHQVP